MNNTNDSTLSPASDADKNNEEYTASIPNYADRLYWVLESFSGVSLNLDITLLGVDGKIFTDPRTDRAQSIIRYLDGEIPDKANRGDYVAYSSGQVFGFKNNFFKQIPGTIAHFEVLFTFQEPEDAVFYGLVPVFKERRIIKVVSSICAIGKFYQQYDETCQTCRPGTKTTVAMATYCEACYENAVCLGGDSTYPIPGYMRMHKSTDLIVRCFNREACSGVTKEEFPK